jgi:hypothetical protein
MTFRSLLLLLVACPLLLWLPQAAAQDAPRAVEMAVPDAPPDAVPDAVPAAPPNAVRVHRHWGLEFTGRVEFGPSRDPRLKQDIRYAPVGDVAMIEGDICVGKVESLRAGRFYDLVEDVKMTGPEEKLDLTPQERAVMTAMRALPLPEDEMRDARVRHTDRAKRILVQLLEGEDGFRMFAGFPALEVEALKESQAKAKAEGLVAPYALVQADARFRWPNGVVPYAIDPSVPDRAAIQQAIDHWHTMTDRIHLRAWQGDANYVRFVAGSGCSSYIGRVGGAQPITLEYGCRPMQIIHEIGHAVGLWHEQCRNDRDRYLAILEQNVAPQMLFNFDQSGAAGRDTGPFDFQSVMLYDGMAFSANGRPTMLSRNPAQSGTGWGLGNPQINKLSEGDLQGVARMYPAPANPPNPKHR